MDSTNDRHYIKLGEDDQQLRVTSQNSVLQCDHCGDPSLSHDSEAWFDEQTKELLCDACYALPGPRHHVKVVTYH